MSQSSTTQCQTIMKQSVSSTKTTKRGSGQRWGGGGQQGRSATVQRAVRQGLPEQEAFGQRPGGREGRHTGGHGGEGKHKGPGTGCPRICRGRQAARWLEPGEQGESRNGLRNEVRDKARALPS